MYVWTPDSIRFRIDAAEYTRYDEKIAERILPHLPAHASVCDAGCGLGHLSLALSSACARVAAADTNAEALGVLRGNIARLGIRNIDVLEGDLFAMRPKTPYDAMVFCFFGRTEETLRAAKAQCRGKVCLVKKNWVNHRFTLRKTPLEGYTFRHALSELEALGVPFRRETFSIEMGQPFRSLEDAALFFETYRQEEGERIFANQIKRFLRANDSIEFPFYLPSRRTLGLIEIDVRDIPGRFAGHGADSGTTPIPDKSNRRIYP